MSRTPNTAGANGGCSFIWEFEANSRLQFSAPWLSFGSLGSSHMHVMFAEDIGGWLLAAGALFGGLGASVLALGALIPASKGKRSLTLALSAPAFVLGVVVTVWLVYGYMKDGLHDADVEIGHDLILPWIVMAGPALVTSLLSITVLWYKRSRQNTA